MKLEIDDLTEEEILLLLEFRKKNNKNQKGLFKKYIFNKYFLFDVKQALVRETVKTIFLIYIIDYFRK